MIIRFCETLNGRVHSTLNGRRTLCGLVVYKDDVEPERGQCYECKKMAHGFRYSAGLAPIKKV